MTTELDRVIAVILEIGKIESLGPDADIYDAGFNSASALALLTELEDAFNVTIPDDRFPAARTARALLDLIQEVA
jgi:acyl carrier protein